MTNSDIDKIAADYYESGRTLIAQENVNDEWIVVDDPHFEYGHVYRLVYPPKTWNAYFHVIQQSGENIPVYNTFVKDSDEESEFLNQSEFNIQLIHSYTAESVVFND